MIKQTNAVPEASLPLMRKQCQCVIGNFNLFGVGDFTQVRGSVLFANRPKVETLYATNDGCRKLVDVGCGQNKYDVFRRFFKRFEKCVKCGLTEHMDFVNDIDFFTSTGGRNLHFIA